MESSLSLMDFHPLDKSYGASYPKISLGGVVGDVGAKPPNVTPCEAFFYFF